MAVQALSWDDRHAAFLRATCTGAGTKERWAARAQSGMSDKDLEAALKSEIGEFGGHSGPDRICVTYQRAGLRIWASWHMMVIPSDNVPPIFKDASTVSMARLVFGIADPTAKQAELF